METRLIIAYSLIAIMVALAIFGVVKFMQKQAKSDRRNAGQGAAAACATGWGP